jgi:hypothetical protein
MFKRLTDDLLELTATDHGVGRALFALNVDCCSCSCCCCAGVP